MLPKKRARDCLPGRPVSEETIKGKVQEGERLLQKFGSRRRLPVGSS
jgi:hypothetical protein